MASEAITIFESALSTVIVQSGLLTDELENAQNSTSLVISLLDERLLPEGEKSSPGGESYAALQNVRALSAQAFGALIQYDTAVADRSTNATVRAELYALEGYSEILLADLFCSGVPLSTLDFQHDFTYHASATTVQVYQDAIAKEDSALSLADTNQQLRNLAHVLTGRAWLALGNLTAAAQAVAAVPTSFQFRLPFSGYILDGSYSNPVFSPIGLVIADREGETGLPYRSSHDPRTAPIVSCIPPGTNNRCPVDTLTFAAKYTALLNASDQSVPIPIADGIEARLIQAEAAYHGVATGQGDWLAQLNTLRQTAITPALPTLNDPGTAAARVALLFQERAYWLFLTGHRQGDLRRLVRQYGLPQNEVYPTGAYLVHGSPIYGTDVNIPIPVSESVNPLFHGCLSRGA